MSLYNNYIDSSYNDHLIEEGIKDDIGQAVSNIIELKKQWQKKADTFVTHKWIDRYINEKQKAMLDKYYDDLTREDVSYGDYKKAFNFICKFMGLPSKAVIIENLVFNKDKTDKEQMKVAVRYSKGLFKVKIPKSVMLIHVSPADNIQELIPSFRSKTKGKYMYPSKRVFFTVLKAVSGFKGGNENTKTTKYTTKETYTEAWIDPTYNTFMDNAVYIETDKPIPVMKLKNKLSNLFNLRRESVTDLEGEYFQEDSAITEETLLGLLKNIKDWKVSNETSAEKEFKSTTITDKEYLEIKELFKTLHTAEYPEYKKAFDKLCKICHIVPKGTIITKHELTKSKEEDKNTLYVKYSYNTKKIDLPEEAALYHMSKVGGIKELIPTFRGKSEKGYLYDKPRVYFTINKDLPKAFADYKITEKMHKYKCLENIKQAYVDPLVRNGLLGAVYVETDKPIKVDELTK